MAMVVVDDSSLQADSQPKSRGLFWGSAATWRCSTFIKWTEWTLAMTLWSYWQHYKHCHGYYYYYYYYYIKALFTRRLSVTCLPGDSSWLQVEVQCSGACVTSEMRDAAVHVQCVCVCDACRTSSRCVVRSSVSGCCYSFASVFSYELSVFVRRVSCPCFFAACNCWNLVSLTPTTDEIMRYVPFQCLSVFQRDDSRSWGRILAKCSLSKDYWGLILYPLLLLFDERISNLAG